MKTSEPLLCHTCTTTTPTTTTTATTTGKFRDVNGAFASQLTAQNNADHAPNAGMLAAFAATSRQLSATQTAWARILERELPTLNVVRTRLGLTPIPAPRRATR